MAKSSAPNTSIEEKETLFQHFMRSTKNICNRCCGCMHTSEEMAIIKHKERRIVNRKKKFGVVYMNMLGNNSTEEELKKAVDECLEDVDILVKQIEKIENDIERVKRETEGKMKYKPGKKNVAKESSPEVAIH